MRQRSGLAGRPRRDWSTISAQIARVRSSGYTVQVQSHVLFQSSAPKLSRSEWRRLNKIDTTFVSTSKTLIWCGADGLVLIAKFPDHFVERVDLGGIGIWRSSPPPSLLHLRHGYIEPRPRFGRQRHRFQRAGRGSRGGRMLLDELNQ